MLSLQFGGVGLSAALTGILFSVALFLVGFVGVLLLGKFVFVPAVMRVLGSRGFDEAVRSLGSSVANAVVWVAAIAIGFTMAGYSAFLSAFAVFGGAIALAVGFAAQDLLGNFVAGIFILKDKPFEVGDWIEWDGNAGRVEDIDLRVSRVRTFDNERITVPNGDLANNAVTNPVAYETLRQKFVFGIGYEDDDIAEATDIIEKARGARGDPRRPRALGSGGRTGRLRRRPCSRAGGSASPAGGLRPRALRVRHRREGGVRRGRHRHAVRPPAAHR